jgi:mono/diheme cytochrome c family protein
MRSLRVASAAAAIFITAFVTTAAPAQQPAALNDTQRLGQDLFAQSCGVCHFRPQLTAVQFAPVLSRESASGNERAIREVIANGTARMPGFKYQFTPDQIAAIAAYLITLPPPAATSAPAAAPRRENSRDAD